MQNIRLDNGKLMDTGKLIGLTNVLAKTYKTSLSMLLGQRSEALGKGGGAERWPIAAIHKYCCALKPCGEIFFKNIDP